MSRSIEYSAGRVVAVMTALILWLLYVVVNWDVANMDTLDNEELVTSLNQENANSKDEKARRLPQAIIIGSRKSGTRALLKFLEVNPHIRSAHKEVHFFDKPENYLRGINWYRNQMPRSDISDITIEKSPSYFVTPGVAERIKAMNSSIKLILIVRDPVTRLISDYSQIVANKINDQGTKDYPTASDYVMDNTSPNGSILEGELIWRKAERLFERYVLRPDGGIDDQKRAVKTGMYSTFLEQWKAHFPLKQFHFVDGENLISNPYEELHMLEVFLGVKPKIKPSDFSYNPKKGFYCLSTSISTSSKDLSSHLTRLTRSSSNNPDTKEQSKQAPGCLSKSKGRRHVVVKKNLINELSKFYAPYNEYFLSMTGKKFNWTNQ